MFRLIFQHPTLPPRRWKNYGLGWPWILPRRPREISSPDTHHLHPFKMKDSDPTAVVWPWWAPEKEDHQIYWTPWTTRSDSRNNCNDCSSHSLDQRLPIEIPSTAQNVSTRPSALATRRVQRNPIVLLLLFSYLQSHLFLFLFLSFSIAAFIRFLWRKRNETSTATFLLVVPEWSRWTYVLPCKPSGNLNFLALKIREIIAFPD